MDTFKNLFDYDCNGKLDGVEKYLAWGKYCQYLEESNAREDVELPFQDEYDDEYDCDDEY